ncbi:hypothetical protein Q7A53_09740 [Halobacillus rhizosphaerae]|uniref:hypothetical protein n=1 Tax=Halobacillus rhizosphaerae TaxID=3064889 RepID=UPI00398B9BE5
MSSTLVMKVWKPMEEISGELDKVEVRDGAEGLIIIVENETREFIIKYQKEAFNNFVLAFRSTSEMKSSYLGNAARKARIDFFGSAEQPWSLYKMESSDFIKWFDQLSGPGSDIFDIEHQLIITSETTYEILSTYEPVITVKNK